jgi:hypothetical protein
MQNRHDARPRGDDEGLIWRPQAGDILAGVIHQYTISRTSQGLVRTVIVTDDPSPIAREPGTRVASKRSAHAREAGRIRGA